MKKMKPILSMLLVAIMSLSVVSCAPNTPVPGGETTATTAGDSKDEGQPASSDSKYPDPSKPVKFSFFGDVTWLAYDMLDGITSQEVERQTGVSFDFTKATDAEQLVLLMSSNDLPDLVMASSMSKLNDLSSSDLCYPLNELIEKHTPDWEVSEIEKNINSYYSQDGNFYMLKNEFNTIDDIAKCPTVGPNFGQLHMREDIYKEMGSPAIKNKDDLFALLEKVKTTYPDMVPLTINMREYGGLAQLVGYDPWMPTDANGNYVYAISDPKFREMWKVINEMARKGYITSENFTFTTDEQTFQNVATGKAFMITHYAGNDDQTFTGMVQKTIPEASFVQVPLMENWNYTIGVSGWAGMFITQNNKDPETAIKFLRWVKEPKNQITAMMGAEGTDWEMKEDGSFVSLDRYNQSLAAGNVESDYKPIGFLTSATDYIRESTKFFTAATPATREIFQVATKKAKWSNVVDLCSPKSGTDEKVMTSNLATLLVEYEAKLGNAKSEEEFDKFYDECLVEADKIGIVAVNEYLGKTYKELSEQLGTK